MEKIIYLNKNKLNIKKINISKIILYFTIYSFIGFCLESIFGIVTKGVLESRKSFIFGPFCAIYGIGAIIMITTLRPLKNNTIKLFISSMFIGAITEYLMSYICEIYFHFKWWDYSNYLFNIHGRTCLFYMIIWGILGSILIKYVNPKIEKIILKLKNTMPINLFKISIIGISIFFIIDIIITIFALKYFFAKISIDYLIPQSNYSAQKLNIYSKSPFLNTDRLLRNFPNIQLAGKYMNNTFVDSLYTTKTYYIKLFKTQ